jgi:hypothetical protein
MKPYYYVYRYNDRGPKVRHATLEAAQTEAMRLAEQHPTGYFEILKCVGFARTTKAATFWMDGEVPKDWFWMDGEGPKDCLVKQYANYTTSYPSF